MCEKVPSGAECNDACQLFQEHILQLTLLDPIEVDTASIKGTIEYVVQGDMSISAFDRV